MPANFQVSVFPDSGTNLPTFAPVTERRYIPPLRFCSVVVGFFIFLFFNHPVLAQQPTAQSLPSADSSYIHQDGTAYITRIVAVPQTISPEAQKSLARQATPAASHDAPSPPKKPPVQTH